ncbi:hypothetical protein [Nocardia sp. Marseille-Q1738]
MTTDEQYADIMSEFVKLHSSLGGIRQAATSTLDDVRFKLEEILNRLTHTQA